MVLLLVPLVPKLSVAVSHSSPLNVICIEPKYDAPGAIVMPMMWSAATAQSEEAFVTEMIADVVSATAAQKGTHDCKEAGSGRSSCFSSTHGCENRVKALLSSRHMLPCCLTVEGVKGKNCRHLRSAATCDEANTRFSRKTLPRLSHNPGSTANSGC